MFNYSYFRTYQKGEEMSSIKNWIVTSERISGKSGGVADYASYLISETHKNHKNTKIIPLFNASVDKFIQRTICNTIVFDGKNLKGGRKVESYAQSFNFILPPPIKPTEDQWKKISSDLIKKAHQTLEIKDDANEFLKHIFVNIHDQSNPHVNLLIPRIYKDIRLTKLDQRQIIKDLKEEFNLSVLKHCNIDFKEYKPQKQKVGKRRRKWQTDQDIALTSTAHVARTIAEADEATAKAQEATAKALLAKAEAERATTLVETEIRNLNKFQKLILGFADSLMSWINSVRANEYLNSLASRSELVNKANSIIEHPLCSDETYNNLNSSIESSVKTLQNDGFDVEKPELSNKIRRGVKPS